MTYLLLGGAPKVGKSDSIYRCALNLIAQGFMVAKGTVPPLQADFKAVLEGTTTSGNFKRILINSASDTPKIIEDFKNFRDQTEECDIYISSVRDGDFWPRKDFFKILNIDPKKDFILEIPLAKIPRKKDNLPPALDWCRQKVDNLVEHCLQLPPYNL